MKRRDMIRIVVVLAVVLAVLQFAIPDAFAGDGIYESRVHGCMRYQNDNGQSFCVTEREKGRWYKADGTLAYTQEPGAWDRDGIGRVSVIVEFSSDLVAKPNKFKK